MAAETLQSGLVQVVALLGAGVIAVPIFRRLGLGSVLGYFAAGVAIGPFGFGLFSQPDSIVHVAEFGVIMLLFIIGLEMQPARLWNLRRVIFGLGVSQVALCGALLTAAGYVAGLRIEAAFIAGMGFVLSSTAVVAQMLDERGETSTPQGQKAIAILLLEDLAIVPLLAIVAFLAPGSEGIGERWSQFAIGIGSIAGLLIAGRYILNPMFGLLAASSAREVMTAAALLVVLGSALLMQIGGLSMAMGAFLAGVLLSESVFRHQLIADIEPFRGILLGLFFMTVGMALPLGEIAANWPLVLLAVVSFICVASIGIYLVARLFGEGNREAIVRVSLFAQGGEFAFVLYSAATAAGIFDARLNAIFTATVIISMALAPITALFIQRLMPREEPSMDGIAEPENLQGTVLIIGFGRFAQVVSQSLLARGIEVAIIENDVEMIRSAAEFGFKVYYGDGTRLDILRASGAGNAEAILVCVDKREAADRIVELVRAECPLTKIFVRAYDRGHALDLIHAGVDYQLRETFESAMEFGREALVRLGVPQEEADAIAADVRRRDAERLQLQVAADIYAGTDLLRGNAPVPTPLTKPKRAGRIVASAEAGEQADSLAGNPQSS